MIIVKTDKRRNQRLKAFQQEDAPPGLGDGVPARTVYDDTTMPQELRQAHLANDRAVMKAYGFAPTSAEAEIVTKLFALYEALAKQA